MEDWSKDFFKNLETWAVEVEAFLTEFTEDAVEAIEAISRFSEEIIEQLNQAIFVELDQLAEPDQRLDPFIDPFLELLGLELMSSDPMDEEIGNSLPYPVEPVTHQHPACAGCRNYHGQIYGGNLLVCAMHPYGWEDEQCPDWEGFEGFRLE